MNKERLKILLLCALLAWADSFKAEETNATANDGELRRRGILGAQIAPVTGDVANDNAGIESRGVLLEKIIPGTSAAEAELKVGDVIQRVDDIEVHDSAGFLAELAKGRSGDTFTLAIIRDDQKLSKQVTLKEMPREVDEHFTTTYGHVTSSGVRLRSIITHPKSAGPHPAVLFLPGYGNFSIDQPVGPPSSFTRIVRHLARNGYVTMRVDRRGCGDSEGAPCRDMDFNTEVDGYRQALKSLREVEGVEADNIFIFGHSLGGFIGPVLAAETPIRGIASYGTIAGSWSEGLLSQRQRIASLEGKTPAEVEERFRLEEQFWNLFLVEKKTPSEIRENYPELSETVAGIAIDDTYVYDRTYKWFHQVAEIDIGEIWKKMATTPLDSKREHPVYPQVLSIWGASDWVAEKDSNARVAEIVNRARPGNGTFIALDSSDHFFFHAASPKESFQYFQPAKDAPFGKFNPSIFSTIREWLDEISAS